MKVHIKYGAGVEKADKVIKGVTEIREHKVSIYFHGQKVAPCDERHKKAEIIDMFVEMEER